MRSPEGGGIWGVQGRRRKEKVAADLPGCGLCTPSGAPPLPTERRASRSKPAQGEEDHPPHRIKKTSLGRNQNRLGGLHLGT